MKKISILLISVILFACTGKKDSNLSYSQLENRYQESIDSIYNANPDVKGIMVHIESPSNNMPMSFMRFCSAGSTLRRAAVSVLGPSSIS